MISAKEASVWANLLSLFGGRIEVLQMELHYPEIVLSRNRQGVTNFAYVVGALAKPGSPSKPPVAAFALNRVSIQAGSILYFQEGADRVAIMRDVDLLLADCSAERACLVTADARLLDSQNSRLAFS
jgi:uncharacterized protein involved in outer membrane biogenesis